MDGNFLFYKKEKFNDFINSFKEEVDIEEALSALMAIHP